MYIMTLRFNLFARLFRYEKKWVKIALKYFAKLFFIGLFIGFNRRRAFHGAWLFLGTVIHGSKNDST